MEWSLAKSWKLSMDHDCGDVLVIAIYVFVLCNLCLQCGHKPKR